MSTDPLLQRLRRANPALLESLEDDVLFAAIVATPRDLRPVDGPRAARRRPRLPVRLGVALAVLSLGAATAWATGVASPVGLFRSSENYDSNPGSLWHQQVIPDTVRPATTVAIPGVGPVELWYGSSRQGGICTALKLPDGTWAGTSKSPLDAGGASPTCRPTRGQVNSSAGTPIYVLDGFDYDQADIQPEGPGEGIWRVDYGIVQSRRAAVRVVDQASGSSTPVASGGLFALPLWDPHPTEVPAHGPRLLALDARGQVVARESGGDPSD